MILFCLNLFAIYAYPNAVVFRVDHFEDSTIEFLTFLLYRPIDLFVFMFPTAAYNTSILSNMSAVSMTTINETGLSRPPALIEQSLSREERRSPGRNATSLKDRAQTAKESALEVLSSINLTNAKAGSFLDGCKVRRS